MRHLFTNFCKQNLKNNLFVLLGDIGVGGFLNQKDELLKNVFNMGINEQAMVSFAGGLASDKNLNIICHTISPFLIERAYEQIKLTCGYNRLKLILVSANGPYEYEKLGPTHHCPADVNLLNLIPNIDIYLPSSADDLLNSLKSALKSKKSSYIRLTNRYVPNFDNYSCSEKSKFIKVIKRGKSKNLAITTGESLFYALNSKYYDDFDILNLVKPKDKLPNLVHNYRKLHILEPYLESIINIDAAGKNIKKFTYKKEFKKRIKKNLGYEDFR